MNNGGRYSPTTETWTAVSTNGAPSRRQSHVSVWTGTEMIVWGGEYNDGADHYLNNGGRYNPATDTWTPLTTNAAPSPRWVATALWTDSEFIVWGGYNGNNSLNDGGRYDPVANTWTPISTNGAPQARIAGAMVWTGSQMLLYGGSSGSGLFFNDTWSYTPSRLMFFYQKP